MVGYESLLAIQVILLMIQAGAVIALVLLAYKLGNLAIHLLLKEIFGEDKQ